MKRIFYSLGLVLLFFILSANGCTDTGEPEHERDPALVGYWQAINSEGQVFAFEFNENGTAVQITPATTVEYSRWVTKGSWIYLTFTGGAVDRRTDIEYKLEGRNHLYLRPKDTDTWSVAYIRTAN